MRLGRILTVLVLASLVYAAFFWAAPGGRAPDAFDPGRMATFETEVLQSIYDRNDLLAFIGTVRLLREQHRFPWWQAASAAYRRSRALTTIANRPNRYEVVLPDLEAALTVERDWRQATFDPVAAARAELEWRQALRQPQYNSESRISDLMAEELALRYGTSPADVRAAAQARTAALRMLETSTEPPDWFAVEEQLDSAYRALRDGVRTSRPSPTS